MINKQYGGNSSNEKKGWKEEDPEGGGRQTWRQLSKKVVYNGLREARRSRAQVQKLWK